MSGALHALLREGLRRGRRPYLAGTLLLAATNGLSLSIPWLLRGAVDGLRSGAPLGRIGLLCAGMAAIGAAQALVRTASRVVILGYSRRAVAAVRERLQAHLLRLPASFYDRARVGDLMSRAVNDLRALRNFFGPGVLTVMNAVLVSAGALGMMLWLDVRLTLAALVACPLFVALARRSVRQIYLRSRIAQERLADLTSRVEQSIMGHLQIKVFSQEEREIAAFEARSAAYRGANLSLARAQGRMAPMVGVLGGLGALAVLGLGGWRVARGAMTLGDFVAFNVLLGQLTGPLITLGWTLDLFQRGRVGAQRIQEILDAPPAFAPLPGTGRSSPGPREVRGAVEMRDVEFAYGEGRGAVLRGVHLAIRPGERVGIVGPVGSGKSTLLALAAGLYAPVRGTVLLDGAPLAGWPLDDLRRGVVLAPQDAFLFSRSLADNVRLGRPGLSREEIDLWLSRVAFDRDLESLPDRIDTQVGERGLSVSGGQRQRVALARALAVEARVLLLDDPLSMVDPDTEARILESLEPVLRGRTVLIATHRAGWLPRLDRVVVLEGGRVVEEGAHDDLVRRAGAYARLALTGGLEFGAGGAA